MSGFAPPPKFPVAEVFGPTLQGEGPLAGMSTYFVRFGGCDYLCEWCDSLHAVLPEKVRELERLDAKEIRSQLLLLPKGPRWVTLSGGNPAMLKKLVHVVDLLHEAGYLLSVETQGSRWSEWLRDIDQVVVSPKPPSSGMATEKHEAETYDFMHKLHASGATYAIKIVVFNEEDYEWAAQWLTPYQLLVPCFISVGTDSQGEEDIGATLARYAWLAEKVSRDDRLQTVRAFPQLHVLAWGHALGV